MTRRRPQPWMVAVAIVALAVAVSVMVPRVTGGHNAHGGGTTTTSSPPADRGADRSSALGLAVAGVLFSGWALAFTIGIWRRWRITDNVRADEVSETVHVDGSPNLPEVHR